MSRRSIPVGSFIGSVILLIGCFLSACGDASWRQRKIAIVSEEQDKDGSNTGISVMNADGSKKVFVTPWFRRTEGPPAWSPDGKKIAFVEGGWPPAEQQLIHIVNADGSGLLSLHNTRGLPNKWGLAWSPDGTKIAFVSALHLASPNPVMPSHGPSHIFVINADDSGRVQLTRDPDWINWSPTWSPYGKIIAFVSSRKSGYGIYVMNADGSDQRLLAAGGTYPRWSPDGQKMAYFGPRADEKHLHLINSDGSGEVRVLIKERGPERAPVEYPAWSPDSKKLLVTSVREGNAEIFLVAGDGSGLTRLTTHDAFDGFPAWFPDGRKIAFVSDRNVRNKHELYIMNADGTDIIRVGARVGSWNIVDLESKIPFALASK